MPPARPWPLAQGSLDGLCGLYSIINSLAWGLYSLQVAGHRPSRDCRSLNEREAEELFLTLITRLTRKHGAGSVVHGINALELARLLRHSGAWLTNRRGVQLSVVRPFYQRPRATMPQVCRVISEHLAEVGTATIIGLEWPDRHWTVVIGVTESRLYLLDSSDDPPHSSLRRRLRRSDKQGRLLRPRETFLLKLHAGSRTERQRSLLSVSARVNHPAT